MKLTPSWKVKLIRWQSRPYSLFITRCETIKFSKQEKLRYFINIYMVVYIQFQIWIRSKSGESWSGHTKLFRMFDNDVISSFEWWYRRMFGECKSLGEGDVLGQLRLLTRRDWNRWNGFEQASSGIISVSCFLAYSLQSWSLSNEVLEVKVSCQ